MLLIFLDISDDIIWTKSMQIPFEANVYAKGKVHILRPWFDTGN